MDTLPDELVLFVVHKPPGLDVAQHVALVSRRFRRLRGDPASFGELTLRDRADEAVHRTLDAAAPNCRLLHTLRLRASKGKKRLSEVIMGSWYSPDIDWFNAQVHPPPPLPALRVLALDRTPQLTCALLPRVPTACRGLHVLEVH